jgi:Trk K+ transport system NAD-binding subunit
MRGMKGEFTGWHGHVIVCGLHGVGLRIVEELSLSGVPAVVVDDYPDPRLAATLHGWGVPHLAASPRSPEALAAAGLPGAAAVICALEDDLQTLEAALLTRDLRAGVRVIVQLGNPAVGRALAAVGISVLDVAGLSAPSIAQACLRVPQEITLAGQSFQAGRVTAARAGTLRELYGALTPVAVLPAGGDAVICPGRDHRVAAGDDVTLFGTPGELAAAGVHGVNVRGVSVRGVSVRGVSVPWAGGSWAGAGTARAARRRAVTARHLALSLAGVADRRLALAMGALVTVLVAATIVLRFTYHLPGARRFPLLDAAYFTVETVTTVGYGDFTFRHQNPWLMAGAIGLMMLGATFVAVFFALLTNLLVSRRIEESLGRGRVTGRVGHVLVIGLGAVGLRAVQLLAAQGADVVVVEKNEGNRHLAQVRALGVPVVIADATQPQALASVSLASAAAVAVLTSDDLANLETGLAVRDQLGRRFAATPVVLRIFDPRLASSVRSHFGFEHVRSTAALAAPWFVGAALGMEVLSTFYAGPEPLLVARFTVTPEGGLSGLAMRDLAARTRVLALSRASDDGAGLEYPPRRGTRFRPGDRAYVIGPYEELLAVLRQDRPAPGQAQRVSPEHARPPDARPGDVTRGI